MTRPTFLAHRATVLLMAVVVLVATGDGFAQSYAGLYRWALEHHLSDWKAASFPLLVDLFVGVGELGMFALALEGVRLKGNRMAWADLALPFGIASAGWGVSLVFNVGAVRDDFADQATAAVPPVASMLGLLVLLRTLHRLVSRGLVAGGYEASTLTVADLRQPEPWTDAQPVGMEHWNDIEPEPEPAALPWWPVPEITGPVPVPAVATGVPGEERLRATVAQDDEPEADTTLRDPAKSPVTDPDLGPVVATARERYAEMIAAGRVPSIRRIRREIGVGYPRAKAVHEALASQ